MRFLKTLGVFIVVLTLILSMFSACTGNTESLDNSPTVSEQYTPRFFEIDAGKLAIRDLVFVAEGWALRYRPNYLFAMLSNFVVRYNITENRVDRIVELGELPEGYYFVMSFSQDGRYSIVFLAPIPGWENVGDHKNYFLMDFDEEQVTLISTTFDSVQTENLPGEVESRSNHIVFVANEARPAGITDALIMSSGQIGAIMPADSEMELELGFYKFVIIDADTGEIIQEYALNVDKHVLLCYNGPNNY